MTIGKGSINQTLTSGDVEQLLAEACEALPVDGKRVLVIIPDSTRTALIPLFFRLLYEQLGQRVAQLDYLIALGTHPAMLEKAIDQLVGVSADERAGHYPKVRIFNHQWSQPEMLKTIGVISRQEANRLTDGLLADDVLVTLNRLIFAYDQLIICGPVFPHEVVGFSGGAKYLFPGIAGPDIINFTHWLGALVTSMQTIGFKDTPVRRIIHCAAEFVTTPLLCIAMVLKGQGLYGLSIGSYLDAWSQAADLSANSISSWCKSPLNACSPCQRQFTMTCGQRPKPCTKQSQPLPMAARSLSTRRISRRYPTRMGS